MGEKPLSHLDFSSWSAYAQRRFLNRFSVQYNLQVSCPSLRMSYLLTCSFQITVPVQILWNQILCYQKQQNANKPSLTSQEERFHKMPVTESMTSSWSVFLSSRISSGIPPSFLIIFCQQIKQTHVCFSSPSQFRNHRCVLTWPVLSPFLIGRMFVREPSWKCSANLVGS